MVYTSKWLAQASYLLYRHDGGIDPLISFDE